MPIRSALFRTYLLLAAVSATFACSPLTATTPNNVASKASNAPATSQVPALNLRRGQILSMTAPVASPDAEAARKAYFAQAFPLARKEGLKNVLTLKTVATLVGDFSPEALVFYVWPDKEAEENFTSNVKWPAIKAQRANAWDHLRIYNSEVEKDQTITFSPKKHYSVAVAWTNPDRPNDYRQYLQNLEETVNQLGGRFVFTLKNPGYETHTPPFDAPGQVTFVEWDTQEALSKLSATEGYQQNVHLLRSGTTRFELHFVAPVS